MREIQLKTRTPLLGIPRDLIRILYKNFFPWLFLSTPENILTTDTLGILG